MKNKKINEVNEELEKPTEEQQAPEVSERDFEKEILELTDKRLRLMAEYENYKKRTQKEKESTYEFAVSNTVANILPVLDMLELSLKQETDDVAAFKTGVELVVKQFSDALGKMNVSKIEAINTQFDPELHNAVMMEEEGDAESGTVLEELQKGYKINDRVIRHSMVKVKA
jgi:molecular chaperone GrpE